MQSLFVTLKGPLRSWGALSIGDNRETNFYPTASAILGLAGACIGVDQKNKKETTAWYTGFSVITISAIKYIMQYPSQNQEAVIEPALLTDFHTVQNSLAMNDESRSDTIISERDYITDGLDVAALVPRHNEAEGWLENLVSAFIQPTYTPFLGRRGNVFSEPVLEQGDKVCEFASISDLTEKLFHRFAKQKVGEFHPSSCLLRVPGKNGFDTSIKKTGLWCPGKSETVLDQRTSFLRFHGPRFVREYYRDFNHKEAL
jgi:CRISPR system Cascade subunit CasD